ncbi:hypothetical protein ACET3Z_015915 [Daucus carota]
MRVKKQWRRGVCTGDTEYISLFLGFLQLLSLSTNQSIGLNFEHVSCQDNRKIFGGTTPGTVSNKEWAAETEKKFQAWPRTAGPPVVMNPISRQNFIVKAEE